MIKKLEDLLYNQGGRVHVTYSKDFLEKADIIQWIIAISGGADQPGKEDPIKRIIDDFLSRLEPYREFSAIASGGTQYEKDDVPVFGVPAYTTTKAHGLGFPTMGVFPERGEKYAKALFPCLDVKVKVLPRIGQSEWGDECEVFTKLMDATLIIGGGEGTLTDFGHIAKHNRTELDYGRVPIYVIPITGISGISEIIPSISIASKFRESSEYLLEQDIAGGKNAAEYLINKMEMHLHKLCYLKTLSDF